MKYTRKLLGEECLLEVTSLLNDVQWVDGTITGGTNRKNNMQAHPDCMALSKLDNLIYDRIANDEEFVAKITPKETRNIMITKTEVGGYYKPHTDVGLLGHYSTTVFLNDDYQGGELELYYDDEIHSIKLPAGHAITYNTGIPHTVRPVTSGTRYVGVTWTTSIFRDKFHRELCYDLWRAYKNMPEVFHDTLDKWNEEPKDILMAAQQKICRAYGQY